LRFKLRWRLALLGLTRLVAAIVLAMLISLLLDRWLELGVAGRVVFWMLALAGLAHIAYHDLLKPLLVPLSPVTMAQAMDHAQKLDDADHTRLAPKVAAVLELPHHLQSAHGGSEAMIREAVASNYQQVQQARLDAGFDPRVVWRSALLLVGVLLLPIVIAAVWPSVAGLWAQRWFAFSNQPWPRDTTLSVAGLEDGILRVPRGEPFELQVRVEDKEQPTQAVAYDLRGEDGTHLEGSMEAVAEGDFRQAMSPVFERGTLMIEGGDAELGPIKVEPIDRPRLASLELTATHPRNEQTLHYHFDGKQGDLSLLPGTHATLRMTASTPVQSWRVIRGELPDELRQLNAETLELDWTHQQGVRFDIELIAEDAELASFPVPISIRLQPDRPPTVSLASAGVRQRVTPQATIPLTITARDDHGLHRVTFQATFEPGQSLGTHNDSSENDEEMPQPAVRHAGEHVLFGPAQPEDELSAVGRHRFELAENDVKPGELVRLTATAQDDGYAGKQSTPSRTLVFRVVTRDELLREILLRQQTIRSDFRKATADAQAIADGLSLSPTSEETLALAGRFSNLQRRVGSLTRSLQDTATEMQLNQLVGDEAVQLMQEQILDPLTALHDQTMAEQRRYMDRLSRNDDTGELQAAIKRQNEIVSVMNQVLRQMNQWDSFIDVVNQLNEVVRLQEAVLNATRELFDQAEDDLFDD
jgi:hypothetical protein